MAPKLQSFAAAAAGRTADGASSATLNRRTTRWEKSFVELGLSWELCERLIVINTRSLTIDVLVAQLSCKADKVETGS